MSKGSLSYFCILLFVCLFHSIEILAFEDEIPCERYPDTSDATSLTRYFCRLDGTLKRSEEFLLNKMIISKILFYDPLERIINLKFYFEGQQSQEVDYEYNDDGSCIRTFFSMEPLRAYIISKQEIRHGKEVVSQWYYESKPPYKLTHKDTFRYEKKRGKFSESEFKQTIIETRTVYDENGEITEILEFDYVWHSLIYGYYIESFNIYNAKGLLKNHYSRDFDLNVEKLIHKQDLSESEKQRRIQIYRDTSRPLAVVVDSGIDYRHPDLTYKLFNNPYDTPNGKDDDGNGWVDDTMGWYMGYEFSSPVILDKFHMSDLQKDLRPFSHGTHVSSIAMRGVESLALVGFSSYMFVTNDSVSLSKISDLFNKFEVPFINMSFVFEHLVNQDSFDLYIPSTVESFIRRNPKTLVFIAAGNKSYNLDSPHVIAYPASFPNENTLVVGALNTDELNWENVKTYTRADFSNFGNKTVDIFAPGVNVNGAAINGKHVVESGTSMAAPYAMNVAIKKIKEINPLLSSLEIKELIMRSVTFIDIDNPLNCVSGGIINPDRAKAIAEMTISSDKSIRELNWIVRKAEKLGTYGEIHNAEYIDKIKSIWSQDYFL